VAPLAAAVVCVCVCVCVCLQPRMGCQTLLLAIAAWPRVYLLDAAACVACVVCCRASDQCCQQQGMRTRHMWSGLGWGDELE
jgi:hypothetical protein